MSKVKILFLAANPKDTNLLNLDEEIRAITQKIRVSEYRDILNLTSGWAIRPDDLLQTLNEQHPHIVHFSGHGSSDGEIILTDDNQTSKPVSVAAIKALFNTLKDNVRVVLLNACYSRIQAEAIKDVIDCVIGMNSAIGDKAAIIFAASFYRAIGFGRSVKEAFEQGKVALMLEGIPEETTPELLCKSGIDPSTVFLIEHHSDARARIDSSNLAQTTLMVGEVQWEHNASYGVDIIGQTGEINHYPITFIRNVFEENEPDEHDFSIEFDLTSSAPTELRITNIDIDVKGWKPIERRMIFLHPYAGLGEKRKYFCTFDKELKAYPCQFETPNSFIKLSNGEMEVFKLQVNTAQEGIYDLGVSIYYSVGGKTDKVTTEVKAGLWFIQKSSLFLARLLWNWDSSKYFNAVAEIDNRHFIKKEVLIDCITQVRKKLKDGRYWEISRVVQEKPIIHQLYELDEFEQWAKELPYL